jgi:hypothetical protein
MKAQAGESLLDWGPSVFYAEILIDCSVEKAWQAMLDYEAWNPTFAGGSKVTPVSGEPRSEGEVVYIEKTMKGFDGQPLPGFYAKTVKVVPHRHMVWYVHPKDCDDFRNFVDFWLDERPEGVKFSIYYYSQNRMSSETLLEQRKFGEAVLQESVAAFKKYCESRA